MQSLEADISHLTIVAKFGTTILLFIKNEAVLENDPPTLMYNLRFKTFHIGHLQKMLALADFVKVNASDENLQDEYRNQVYIFIPEVKIIESINVFMGNKTSFWNY